MDAIHRTRRALTVALGFVSMFAMAFTAGCAAATHGPAAAHGSGARPAQEPAILRTLVRTPQAGEQPGDEVALEVVEPPEGIVPPYPLVNVIGTFGGCRRGGRQHRAIDLAGTGELLGLGEPIVAMVDAEILLIGRPEDDPAKFGTPDRRPGTVQRGRHTLPRVLEVEGYGTVYPFTSDAGSWHSGAVIVTRAIGGTLDGHIVRYMHLGAVHPDLKVGQRVVAGQEIALMGGTGVQSSAPHLHLDVEDPEGHRVDVAPLLGLEPDPTTCKDKQTAKKAR